MAVGSIPLVSFALARPFVRELELRGIDSEHVLRQVGLDAGSLVNDDLFIAAQTWYDFANLAGEAANDPQFGFHIGANHAVQDLPNLKILKLQMATLGELLTALVIDVKRFSTIANYTLETDGETAQLTTQRLFVPTEPPSQIDGYFAGFMVRILSLCSGNLWKPKNLTITVCDPSAISSNTMRDCNVRKGNSEGAAFGFPATWLVCRTDGLPGQSLVPSQLARSDFIESFRLLLDMHIDRQGLSLSRFAALSGQSPHVLKRRRHEYGSSYRKELDARRARAARFLLQSSDKSSASIGAKVGYPDPPSFARAFKRWTSMTPSEFRKGKSS